MTVKCFRALTLASHLPVSQMILLSSMMATTSTQMKNMCKNPTTRNSLCHWQNTYFHINYLNVGLAVLILRPFLT